MIWWRDALVRASQAVDGHPPGPITIGCVWKASLRVASLHTETSYRINGGLCPLYLRYGTAQKDVQPQRPKKQRNLKAYKAVLPVFYNSYIAKRWQMHLALALSGGGTAILLHQLVPAAPNQNCMKTLMNHIHIKRVLQVYTSVYVKTKEFCSYGPVAWRYRNR